MRTTLTLHGAIAQQLKERSCREGKPFKQVVNETLRAGLGMAGAAARGQPFRVRPHHCGFRPGVDPGKLNQLLDDVESRAFIDEAGRSE